MDFQLSGKVAVVTGGASGIGEAIALQLATEGARVVVLDRNAPKPASPAGFCQTELTNEADVGRAIASVVSEHGGLDILVNNAGVNDKVALDANVNAFRDSLERNLIQAFVCAHHARPHLIRSRGNIVNVSSKVAHTGQGGSSGYAASKGGLNALTREWAVELGPHGVRVNTVAPAEVWTPLYERWLQSTTVDPQAARQQIERLIPLGQRMTTCDEIAAMVTFLASPRSGHTTGQIIYVDGGYTHLDRAFTAPPAAGHNTALKGLK